MTSTSTTTTAGSAPLSRDATGRLLGQTMGLVAVTAGVFALGAYLGRDMAGGWAWVFFIASFAALFGIQAAVQRSEQLAVGLLFAFGLLLGLASAPTVNYYLDANPQIVWQAGGATALFIAGFGAAGYAIRRDLSQYARLFFWALVALIGFGIVLIFVQHPEWLADLRDRRARDLRGADDLRFPAAAPEQDIRSAPLFAASIFLDVLNVFLFFLTIFGRND